MAANINRAMANGHKRAVLAAERAWLEAHRTVDVAALDALMHPDYTIIQPGGCVISKQEALASYAEGQRHWHEATVSELSVRIYGETAIVQGLWRARGVNRGQPFDYAARYTSVWVRHDGRWRMVNDQSTPLTT